MQGIHMLENSKRERIVVHIDFEDVIYVMGKGEKLKIAYTVQPPGSN